MVRTQVNLTEEQSRKLKKIANRKGISISQLIRNAVEKSLSEQDAVPREELVRRSLAALGRFHSGVKDVSAKHDDYLAQAFRK